MKTKEELMQELEAEYANKLALLEIEAKINHLAGFRSVIGGRKPWAVFEVENISQVLHIIMALPAVNESFVQEHGSEKFDVKSPYKITLDSEVRGGVRAKIDYKAELCGVWICFDANLIKEFWSAYLRPITDCEYHYFPGCGEKRLKDLRINAGSFDGRQLKFFGGHNVLIDEYLIAEIIDTIKAGDK
jgi:hypothetical protein